MFALAVLAAGFCCTQGIAVADTFSAPGFATEQVATLAPFTPVGLAFAPDGRLFVWQKNGVVRIIKNGQLLSTPFIDVSAKVNTFDDRGFWGLAFDPNFASNGYVYMSYTYENAGDPNSTAPRTSRLTRVTANPSNPDVAQAGSETTIMGGIGVPPCSAYQAGADCIPADAGSHTLGSLHFSSDGTLFVGVGDGSDGDANSLRAQDLDAPNGKILRIKSDGSAPADNPYYDGSNDWRSRVWLYGVRNPFGFALQPSTEEIFFGDVGWNTWEEVNHGTRTSNFGWPCYEGAGPQPTFQANYTQCQALAASSVTPPFFTYDHNSGSAVIGGPFYTGSLYPQEYQGNFFFGDYSGNFIKRVVLDDQHHPVSVQPFATGVAAPVGMTVGPDGMLYYLSFTSGEVRRIRFNGPVADAKASPTYGYSPLTVDFTGDGSVNPGGGSLTYLWDFGDGTTSTQVNPTHTYSSSTVKTFAAKLTVTNGSGLSSSSVAPVTVGSAPPTPTITAPADGSTVYPGQTITYKGSATDPEDGSLPASSLEWTVLLHHNSHVHTFVGGTGSQGSFVAQDHGAIGTFSYEVILTATDSSGLKKSKSVNIQVARDTSPPTAPSGLTANAPGSGQINLNWSASDDNVGVNAYRVERCPGADCTDFSEIAAPAATSYGDTAVTASTTYRYRVRAADISGNLSDYSTVVTATTPDPPPAPPGLVAAWAFGEGSGTTTADVSGNGNVGTLTSASWSTQGRYGNALSFNGTSSVVRVASSSSLDVGGAMTLEGWVKPTASQSGWRTVLQRQTDAYYLNASSGAGALRPAGGGTFGSGSSGTLIGPTAIPVSTWTHEALTYDGTTMRLYINGVEAVSKPQTGAVQSSTNPLWIGGNTPYGEYFQGLLDEIRVYRRALTASEIQSDMNTSLVPTTPDSTPPAKPAGLTAAAAGGSQINLTWTASTDNVGVSGYRVERCTGEDCTNFGEIGTTTTTSFNDTGLAGTTTYKYRVRAADLAGNLSPYSDPAAATTTSAGDTTPPSAPSGLAATGVSTARIDLNWTASTDNVAVATYRIERCQGTSCTNWAEVGTSPNPSFSNTGLAANTTYRFRVRAADAAGNLSAYSAIVSGKTLTADTTKPSVPSGVTATPTSPTQITVSWTASTDNVGVTGYRVERCKGASCTNWAEIGTTSTTSLNDTGLQTGTLYRYRLRAMDAAANLSSYSAIASATTPSAPDTTAPSAPSGLTAAAAGSSQVNLGWSASADNVGVAGYRVERCQGSGCTGFAVIAAPTTTSLTDSAVAASTTYRYRVRAVDAAGNFSGYSGIAEATTGAAGATPPGLVAAYAFGEGSGLTTADASGNGNTGTLTSTTWSTGGRYGNALGFNGTSSLVRIASAASLGLGSGMTLSGWVKPSATQSGWRTIVQRQTDAYHLNASSGAGALRPAGGGTFGGSEGNVYGPTANPVNAWTYETLTYDGTTLRLYINGTEVATRATTGAIQSSTNPLWIGGNQPYGEYFQGLIDEVRVYNRALTASEVSSDMNSPVNWSGVAGGLG
jgi:glucose/arabinose dehydrogenase/fibronectin type 3 domain-containing protein